MQICKAFGTIPREMKDVENFLIKTLKNLHSFYWMYFLFSNETKFSHYSANSFYINSTKLHVTLYLKRYSFVNI